MSSDPKKLLDLPTSSFLSLLGKGKPTPGSGSATALTALVGGELLQALIKITCKQQQQIVPLDTHKRFSVIEDELKEIRNLLSESVQRDSDEFNEAMRLRLALRKTPTAETKLDYQRNLIRASETQLEVGQCCIELLESSFEVFDSCFADARGDAVVCMSNAISAIHGVVGIVWLNFNDIEDVVWKNVCQQRIIDLQSRLATFEDRRRLCLEQLRPKLLRLSREQIRQKARWIQSEIWERREEIWGSEGPPDLVDMLDPSIALRLLGFEVQEFMDEAHRFTVAGVIDQSNKLVSLSPEFTRPERLFTAAHELGHAVLHPGADAAHRDRAIDGGSLGERSQIDYEADVFAACFLMPYKLLITVFQDYFASSQLVYDDDVRSLLNLKHSPKSLRGFSRAVAGARFYGSENLVCLADHFNVTQEAMAIRLEQLDLVKF